MAVVAAANGVSLDNSELVAQFVPVEFDGDGFLYTELLDRRKGSGRNRGRIVRTFYHRTRDEFFEQLPQMRQLCDFFQVRAYTRLSLRSFRKVGMLFTAAIVEQALAGNWAGMRHGYASACGMSAPIDGHKYWLLDVDDVSAHPDAIDAIRALPEYVTTIPSRAGVHLVVRPHRVPDGGYPFELHKDNPTNLYIPDGAA